MNPRKKKPTSIKRRQLYINKGFQARFIIKFVLILVLGGAITIGLTLFNTQDTLTTTYVNSKLVIQNTALAIMPSVMYTTLITTLIVGLVVVMVTLLVSHKIAGPMFRFEKDIKRIASGDLKSRIHIRKSDQFQEIAASLNTMIDSLAGRVTAIREETQGLGQDQALPQETREKLSRISTSIEDNFRL